MRRGPPAALWLSAVLALLATALPGAAGAVTLPPALQAALPAAPSPEAIAAYFEQGADSLDVFCAAEARCTARAAREALLARFFRGSFARPAGAPPAGAAATAAYAHEAGAYFSDPDYACRRPLTARVLETLWQLPRATPACSQTVPFLVTGDDGVRSIRQLDPARVSAVHLLFAGESGRSLSRFGHVGLRLVVCAETREQPSASCDEDLDEHIALGFRAAVDELNLSWWKGLTGGYALRLYADPFLRLYEDYTIGEFRSLSSLPLQLDDEQRDLLVRALAEVHWAYQHDYRFFTQNCASELAWLLQVVGAVAGGTPWLEQDHVRPDRLFARARVSPAFAGEVLEDLSQAEAAGFYFPGSAPYYQAAIDVLQQRLGAAGVAAPAQDLATLQTLDAATRRQALYAPALGASAEPMPSSPAPARAAHAALVLEAWMEQRVRRELMLGLARYYLDTSAALLERTQYFSDDERQLLERCRHGLASTEQLGGQRDGVPSAPALPETGCALDSAALRTALDKLHRIAPPPAAQARQLAELAVIVDTVNWLFPQTGLAPAPPFPSSPHRNPDP